jgi:hypothetical protein
MEKRRSNRIIVSLKANLISGDISYAGIIENLSEEGIYIRTFPTNISTDFRLGTPVELKFQRHTEEPLNLHLYCTVKWSYKTPPHGLTTSIGLEIIDPPLEYRKFYEELFSRGLS